MALAQTYREYPENLTLALVRSHQANASLQVRPDLAHLIFSESTELNNHPLSLPPANIQLRHLPLGRCDEHGPQLESGSVKYKLNLFFMSKINSTPGFQNNSPNITRSAAVNVIPTLADVIDLF